MHRRHMPLWYCWGCAVIQVVEGLINLVLVPFGWGVTFYMSFVFWYNRRLIRERERHGPGRHSSGGV